MSQFELTMNRKYARIQKNENLSSAFAIENWLQHSVLDYGAGLCKIDTMFKYSNDSKNYYKTLEKYTWSNIF